MECTCTCTGVCQSSQVRYAQASRLKKLEEISLFWRKLFTPEQSMDCKVKHSQGNLHTGGYGTLLSMVWTSLQDLKAPKATYAQEVVGS